MKLAGRLRRVSERAKRQRDRHSNTTVVGIERGDDLQRILVSELAMFKSPSEAIRAATLARWADKGMLQYKSEGKSPLGRGPVVVLLDESSSMKRGARHMWASAITLAAMGGAAKEGRECTVVGFNGGVRYIVHLDTQKRSWTVEKGTGNTQRLGKLADMAMHVATSRPCGGTDFAPAFKAAIDYGLRDGDSYKSRADILLVTDGHANMPTAIEEQLLAAKEDGLQVFGLTVGGGSLSAAVRQLCDKTMDIDAAMRGSESADNVANVIP
jgi:uncharacterized protein with von Willebrand factor type A (vWA) domain